MNIKKFIVILISTFILGAFPALLVGSDLTGVNLPSLFPPKILFPIVWTVLFVLMSISVYLVTKHDDELYIPYIIQMLFNSTWTFIFFGLRWFFLGIIWIIILIVLVSYMIYRYYKYDKRSSYLLIPYLIWLLIALYLNVIIFILN